MTIKCSSVVVFKIKNWFRKNSKHLDKNRIKAKKRIVDKQNHYLKGRNVFEAIQCMGKNFKKINEIQKKISVLVLGMENVYKIYEFFIYILIPIWWWFVRLVSRAAYERVLSKTRCSMGNRVIYCHNFNVDLSPNFTFFSFFLSFFDAIFFWKLSFFFLWQKRSPKNKQVFFYSNTNLSGFRPKPNCSNRFFFTFRYARLFSLRLSLSKPLSASLSSMLCCCVAICVILLWSFIRFFLLFGFVHCKK